MDKKILALHATDDAKSSRTL